MLSAVPKPAVQPSDIAPTDEIIEEIRRGNMVVLVDDEDRENEGDLVFAADFVSAEKINFLAKHGRGLICMPITAEHARRLNLPPMAARNGTSHGTNFTVAIEAAEGVTTGISAADRAHTIRVASRPNARAEDVVQPGHVFPLVAHDGGVLMRAGHTEACCDLTRLAGLNPAAVLCEIMNDDGTAARTWRWCTARSIRRARRWCACTSPPRSSTCSMPRSPHTPGASRARCAPSRRPTAACWCC